MIQLRLDIRLGKREGSVITVNSINAAQGGDEDMWREIRSELKDAGITEGISRSIGDLSRLGLSM